MISWSGGCIMYIYISYLLSVQKCVKWFYGEVTAEGLLFGYYCVLQLLRVQKSSASLPYMHIVII